MSMTAPAVSLTALLNSSNLAFTVPMWHAIFSLSGLLPARSTCLRACGGAARCVPIRFTSSLLHLSPCGATAGLTKLLGEYTVCISRGYGRSFRSSLVSVGSELSHPVSVISVYGAPSLMAVVGPWGFLVRCTLARVSLRLSVAFRDTYRPVPGLALSLTLTSV